MILFVATTFPPFCDDNVVVVESVFSDADDAEVRVDEDIFDDRGPCPIILLGKGSFEVLLDVVRDGAVDMRVRPGPCAISSTAHDIKRRKSRAREMGPGKGQTNKSLSEHFRKWMWNCGGGG